MSPAAKTEFKTLNARVAHNTRRWRKLYDRLTHNLMTVLPHLPERTARNLADDLVEMEFDAKAKTVTATSWM